MNRSIIQCISATSTIWKTKHRYWI